MTVSPREKALAALTVMALLYGLLGLGVRGRLELWRTKRAAYGELIARRDAQRELIAQSGEWNRQYEALRELMPVFAPERRVDTYWLSVMDRVAIQDGVSIVRRQVGAERRIGDAFEMPIECKEWEAPLDALVRFLYDLNAEGAMLDVRQMFIKPAPGNPERLRGSFTLYCAYLRDDAASAGVTPPDSRIGTTTETP